MEIIRATISLPYTLPRSALAVSGSLFSFGSCNVLNAVRQVILFGEIVRHEPKPEVTPPQNHSQLCRMLCCSLRGVSLRLETAIRYSIPGAAAPSLPRVGLVAALTHPFRLLQAQTHTVQKPAKAKQAPAAHALPEAEVSIPLINAATARSSKRLSTASPQQQGCCRPAILAYVTLRIPAVRPSARRPSGIAVNRKSRYGRAVKAFKRRWLRVQATSPVPSAPCQRRQPSQVQQSNVCSSCRLSVARKHLDTRSFFKRTRLMYGPRN